MSRLLVILVFLIVYGSLYPWRFDLPEGGLRELARFLASGAGKLYWRDALVNVVFYVPVGACAYLAFRRRLPRIFAAIAAMMLGTGLSLGIEIAQAVEVSRRTSIYDVLANSFGSAVGVVVGGSFSRASAFLGQRSALRSPPDLAALALIVCWLAYLFFPFLPLMTESAIRAKLPEALTFGLIRFLTAFVSWFVIGNIVRATGVGHVRVLCIGSTLLIPAQLLIYGIQPSIADVVGAVGGALLFASTKSTESSHRAGAAMIVLLLIIRGLLPLDFRGSAQPFAWLPFAALLESDWQRASLVLLTKLFLYGAAIWSLRSTGMSLTKSTLSIAAMLLGIEAAQTRLPHTPDVTDPLLALMIGIAFDALPLSPRRIASPSEMSA